MTARFSRFFQTKSFRRYFAGVACSNSIKSSAHSKIYGGLHASNAGAIAEFYYKAQRLQGINTL
jgi:hypothetical protein